MEKHFFFADAKDGGQAIGGHDFAGPSFFIVEPGAGFKDDGSSTLDKRLDGLGRGGLQLQRQGEVEHLIT